MKVKSQRGLASPEAVMFDTPSIKTILGRGIELIKQT